MHTLTIISAYLAGSLILGHLLGKHLKHIGDDYADAFGDVPALHEEMRPARKWRGDSEQVGRAGTDGSHSHVGTGK